MSMQVRTDKQSNSKRSSESGANQTVSDSKKKETGNNTFIRACISFVKDRTLLFTYYEALNSKSAQV